MAGLENAPWWYSRDEERWLGPHASREEAIREGHGDYSDGDPFMICQASVGELRLRPRMRDELENLNDELMDPESGLWPDASREQWAELDASVESAIRIWAERHGFSTQAWAFIHQGPIETIEGAKE
ncbi:MAG: hypothetical protein KGL39_03820 [Patescibacteria group bacterium]|nr:hypothetical protein [Patescibacteria group bacterium]